MMHALQTIKTEEPIQSHTFHCSYYIYNHLMYNHGYYIYNHLKYNRLISALSLNTQRDTVVLQEGKVHPVQCEMGLAWVNVASTWLENNFSSRQED